MKITGALWLGGNIGYRRPQFRVTEAVALPSNGKIEIAAAVARSIGVASPFLPTVSTDGGHDADIDVALGQGGSQRKYSAQKPWQKTLHAGGKLGNDPHYVPIFTPLAAKRKPAFPHECELD